MEQLSQLELPVTTAQSTVTADDLETLRGHVSACLDSLNSALDEAREASKALEQIKATLDEIDDETGELACVDHDEITRALATAEEALSDGIYAADGIAAVSTV